MEGPKARRVSEDIMVVTLLSCVSQEPAVPEVPQLSLSLPYTPKCDAFCYCFIYFIDIKKDCVGRFIKYKSAPNV